MQQHVDLFTKEPESTVYISHLVTKTGTLSLSQPGNVDPTLGSELGLFGPLLNFGVIGIVLIAMFLRKIRTEGEVREKDKEIERLQGALDGYIKHYQEEVLPALIDVTRLSGDLVAYLNKHGN